MYTNSKYDTIARKYVIAHLAIAISIVLIIATEFYQTANHLDADMLMILIWLILVIVIIIAAKSINDEKQREEEEKEEEEPGMIFTKLCEEEQRRKEEYLGCGHHDSNKTVQSDQQKQVRTKSVLVETEQPKTATPTWGVPKRTESHNRNTVEVTVESTIPMASFVMSVDGRVVGYIGQQKSVLTIPDGMHQMTVEINDSGKKKIYNGNVLFNTGKSITISKKLGGYSVKIV